MEFLLLAGCVGSSYSMIKISSVANQEFIPPPLPKVVKFVYGAFFFLQNDDPTFFKALAVEPLDENGAVSLRARVR